MSFIYGPGTPTEEQDENIVFELSGVSPIDNQRYFVDAFDYIDQAERHLSIYQQENYYLDLKIDEVDYSVRFDPENWDDPIDFGDDSDYDPYWDEPIEY